MTLSGLRAADTTTTAAGAVNSLGIDLLAKIGKPDANALISPYSIQVALAMTYAGADGVTRDEMQKTLHFPKDDAELNGSFAELEKELVGIEQSTAKIAKDSTQAGRPTEPVMLSVTDRIFARQGENFLKPFLETVKDYYGAPVETMDFSDPDAATKKINGWVEDQTHNRIRDLIPKGILGPETALVLVNAIYMKAAWNSPFSKDATEPKPFHVNGTETVDVPAMHEAARFGYAKHEGYTAVTLSYIGSELQFVILLPDDANGLASLESKLNAGLLAGCANLDERDVSLYLPKLKFEPPTIDIVGQLSALGMKAACSPGANFDRMSKGGLCIAHVLHKTFLSLDENGTEAAAATAVVMDRGAPPKSSDPVEVHVDHPFLFAIQHRASGACLFLGRVNDPR